MHRRPAYAALVAMAGAAAVLAGCSSPPNADPAPPTRIPVSGSTAPATTFTTWPQYHSSPARDGHVAQPAGSPLKEAWQADLDGAVYGDPLVIGSTLVAATEADTVYGLDAATGHERWSVSLGEPAPLDELPCGNIDPLGITGTPAYDTDTGSVFVVAETTGGHHDLWAIDPTDGTERWHTNLDLLPERNRSAEQERSALLVAGGRVVVSFGGLAGDCDNYVGYVTSTAVTGEGDTHVYAVPTQREAGMWSPAGPVLGLNGHVYVASGNGAELGGEWDKSDSVTELSLPDLQPVSVFAPETWAEDNRQDLDLGSSSPAVVADLQRLVIAGKRGVVYLLGEDLGGIGSELDRLDGCAAFGGPAVAGTTVLMPCLFQDQVRALRVTASSLEWAWTADQLYGSPVIAGQQAYVADRDSGDLVVLRLADGAVVQRIHAGNLTHFPSEVVDGGYVFVPTLTGVTAFHA